MIVRKMDIKSELPVVQEQSRNCAKSVDPRPLVDCVVRQQRELSTVGNQSRFHDLGGLSLKESDGRMPTGDLSILSEFCPDGRRSGS